MYTIIEKYRTGDGVEHATAGKATEHVESVICDAINSVIMRSLPVAKGAVSAADVHQITCELYSKRADIFSALQLEHFGDDE